MHQMDVPSLLHGLHVFLQDDLGPLLLPPSIEDKRLSLLGQVVRVCHCNTSMAVQVETAEPVPPVPVYLSEPLNCVTRPLTASSVSLIYRLRGNQQGNEIGNKRYSLPPGCMSWTPVPPTIPSVTAGPPQWSADRDRYLRASTEPPLPPKLTNHRGSVTPKTISSDYEIPRALVTTSYRPDSVFRRCTDEPAHSSAGGAGGLSRYLHVVGSPVRSFVNRLSLSPQAEGLLQSVPSTQGLATTGATAVSATPGHNGCLDDTVLTLPKKCLSSQSRRCSSYLDGGWTLAGGLHHRVKPNKWVRLSCCFLTTASRLVGHKSLSAANPSLAPIPAGTSPSLVLFLCGASAVYAGRDSGMEHVIKIAHPTWGTCALAAETEEQAVVWIRQANQYAQGITPTESVSFLDQQPGLCLPASSARPPAATCSTAGSTISTTATAPAPTPVTATTSTCNNSEAVVPMARVTTADQLDGHPHQHRHSVAELQDDSGFSAPISSGSEGNSADGVVRQTSRGNDSEQPYPSELSPQPDDVSLQYSLSQTTNEAPTGSKKSVRRESLLSSMRRKVESFSSKRWARKSLPQSFQTSTTNSTGASSPSSNTTPTGQSQRLSKAASTTQLVEPRQRTTSEAGCVLVAGQASEGLTFPAAAGHVAFGWAQLEWAATYLARQGAAGAAGEHNRPATLLPGQASLSKRLAKPRPQSAIVDRSWYQQQQQQHARAARPTSHQVAGSGDTVLLALNTTTTTASRVIVAGEAQISVPGRVPWTNLWCCLRSHCLDIYSLAGQRTDGSPTASCPVFSLPLEPGRVEFGLAGDKRRRSALRLAAPGQSLVALLFDVAGDTVRMGAWIRGFIQALGIIPASEEHKPVGAPAQAISPAITTSSYFHDYSTSVSGESVKAYGTSSSTAQLNSSQTTGSVDYDCPQDSSVRVEYAAGVVPPSESSLRLGDVTEEEEFGDAQATMDGGRRMSDALVGKNNNCWAGNLYDDVCSASYRNPSGAPFKRHWSSPLLFPTVSLLPGDRPPCVTGATGYGMPVASPLGVFPPAGGHPNPSTTKPTSNAVFLSERWYIPPPSRRLLCQPLPPLPSVGPSGTESLAGTIASSRGATSASLTPDGMDEQRSGSPNPATDDLFIDWPASRSPCAVRPNCWSPNPTSNRVVEPANHLFAGHRHHSSLDVGEYAHVDQSHRYYCPAASPAVVSPMSSAPGEQGAQGQLHPDYDYVVSYGPPPGPGNTATVLLSADVSTIGSLAVAAGDSSTSGTHVGDCGSTSDFLLPQADYDNSVAWLPHAPPAGVSASNSKAMTAAWVLPQALVAAAARRSVSCITGAKPAIAAVAREIATLPTRYTNQHHLTSPTTTSPRCGLPTSSAGSFSTSSTVSRTATSGVSSTPGGLSSSSSASLSLGRIVADLQASSTRPSSLVVVPPVAEEERSPGDVEAGDSQLRALQPAPAGGTPRAGCEPQSWASTSQIELQGAAAAAALPPGSVDRAWVVEVAAQQLEEVHDEVEKLRRRRKTLSFRLSRQLGNEQSGSSSSTGSGGGGPASPPSTEKPAGEEAAQSSAPTDPPVCADPGSRENRAQGSVPVPAPVPPCSTTTASTTASLCARLAIVEAMLSQAEQTEARLLQDLTSWTNSGGGGGYSAGAAAQPEGLATASPSRLFLANTCSAVQCPVRSPDQSVRAGQAPAPHARTAGSPNRHRSKPGHCPCGGGRHPTPRAAGLAYEQQQRHQPADYPQAPASGFHQRGSRPRRGNRGSRWRNRQPATSLGWHRSGCTQPAVDGSQSRRWRPRSRNPGNSVPLMGVAAVCSSAQQ